ncbi:hypothetical protein [Flavobacterium sp.]|uniref:hypothetical protein n=1 Tax=Flavobacterium sp. TaxID=239 RepID=UPI001B4E9775|nr:hypothetical protein [Flavobacterium sp.]MBP6183190.1 hypothetical protein [Flavobacterium sp.]
MEKINILIVSGCMAIQTFKGNIQPEELYHVVLKDYFLEKYNILLIFEIINYDELSPCYDKIVENFESKPADLLLFQVRGHYYLDMILFFSTFKTIERNVLSNKTQKVSIEKNTNFVETAKNKLKNKNTLASIYILKIYFFIKYGLLWPLGYFMGYLFGTEKFAKNEYKKLITNVQSFSENKKVPLLFLGVTSRPKSKAENLLSLRLNQFAGNLIQSLGGTYIDIFGKFTVNNEYKFSTDNLSLSKIGHKEVADKLVIHINKLLPLSNLDKSSSATLTTEDIDN